ncbi:immune inhibitor A [Nocardioides aestuarii]
MLVAGTAALALGATALSPATAATSAPSTADRAATGSPGADGQVRRDNLPNPLAKKQAKKRREALELLSAGKTERQPQRGGGSVVETQSGDAVELFDNDKQANIWTVLSEFGPEVTEAGGEAGPLHNQMAEPDRSRDNSTQWTEDFDVAHYDEMFNATDGESFRNYYLDQSNGEYTTTVEVEDWVTVPRNGNYYGDNDNEARGYWDFVNDTVDAWYEKKKADGLSDQEIAAELAEFDQWDRYDFDQDGEFNEPDGYIDHFQAIHAGAGEEAGGGVLGDDAIWSHRWYADYTTIGQVGPTVGEQKNLNGGQEIGDTGMFVGDYTVEPENGGLGVFAHEYAHDLGLPDFYDTAGGENSTAFWTLMSSGSWMGHGDEATGFQVGIGGTPNDMGAEEKLFLGWLDPQVVEAGDRGTHTLEAAGVDGSNDALQVVLPDVTRTRTVGEPFAGEMAWYSDSGDDLNNALTRDVPAGDSVTVDAQAWYDTEADYDYWYAQFSTDGGNTWENLGTFDGQSNGWEPVSFSYDAGGAASKFRFLYKTDGGVSNPGLMLDEITTTVDGEALDTDGAETDTSAWTPTGWLRTTGSITQTFPRYYLMENKSYAGYDDTLRTGPYNFSEAVTRPDWVEHFTYQDGLLVWYVNHSVADNNVSQHPGSGYALPVDAMRKPLRWSNGEVARNRIQAFDSTFGLQRTDRTVLHRQVGKGSSGKYRSERLVAPTRSMASTFNDRKARRYWTNANPGASVKVAGVGVVAKVLEQTADTITVRVSNPQQ